ncbi:MAG: DinB family protein [Chloroflexi bacterium]|nr:MAG: DinB family protein [Chloroflexota bacterium]
MPTVTQAVEELVRATVGLSDSDMGRPWVWREYDEEGLRFTLLLAQHELRDLAVRLESLRARKGPPQSQTERILGQYHLAYRDLAGVLAGLRDDDLDRVPAVGEWPVREVLEHMLGAEYGFLGVVQYALSPDRPRDAEEAEEGWDSWRVEHGYRAPKTLEGGIADVRNAIFEIHRRVLREVGPLPDEVLEKPAMFWDGEKPIRFRLHRFEAHMVQHTVQVEKSLEWIGRGPTEARRLIRVLYRDLAPVEMLGSTRFGEKEREAVAAALSERAAEVASQAALS